MQGAKNDDILIRSVAPAWAALLDMLCSKVSTSSPTDIYRYTGLSGTVDSMYMLLPVHLQVCSNAATQCHTLALQSVLWVFCMPDPTSSSCTMKTSHASQRKVTTCIICNLVLVLTDTGEFVNA